MPDGHSPPTPVVRHESGRFGPGNPGRPSGARGRRGSHVVDAILDDFIANKDSALKSARFINGPAYLNTIVKLLPVQPSISVLSQSKSTACGRCILSLVVSCGRCIARRGLPEAGDRAGRQSWYAI